MDGLQRRTGFIFLQVLEASTDLSFFYLLLDIALNYSDRVEFNVFLHCAKAFSCCIEKLIMWWPHLLISRVLIHMITLVESLRILVHLILSLEVCWSLLSWKNGNGFFCEVVLGTIAFAVFWVLAVFPDVPFLPIGRTAGSLLGAMLMVISRVLTPDQAYAAIDLPIIGLLFGTMVVSIYLERADMFKYFGELLLWKTQGAKDLLCRICLISAVSSALFTNDTSCVVLTEFVLKVARQHDLPAHPFLLALASSANMGSTATPIGNPQNLVIAVQSKISFGNFVIGVLPAMLVGVCVNALIILSRFWKVLSIQKDEEDLAAAEVCVQSVPIANGFTGNAETLRNRLPSSENQMNKVPGGALEYAGSSNASEEDTIDVASQKREHTVSLERASPPFSLSDTSPSEPLEGKENMATRWRRIIWKSGVYIVTIGMVIGLLIGLDMSWCAITAALALVVLDFADARPSLEKVSYSILIFFCGMFITVAGFNKTGIPSAVWDFVEPHAKIDRASGIAVLALTILLLSNLASNVPTVLLLGARVAASAAAISAAEEKAWLILAWVSTVAGNLSLFGSAANLIVCEQARQAPHLPYTLSFWSHLKFGVPSTLIVTAIGLTLIR